MTWEQTMRRPVRAAILSAACGAALAFGTVAAQEAPTVAIIKERAKQYKVLAPADVYRLARDSVQANVRFRDAFGGGTAIPGTVRQVTLANVKYTVAAAFRTQGDIVCLLPFPPAGMPGPNDDALRMLFGLSERWPLTPGAVSGPMTLSEGQKLTIEGTIAGIAAGEKYLLVDALILGDGPGPRRVRELQVFWLPRRPPQVLAGPGTYELTFPCTHVEGQKEQASVRIDEVTPDAGRGELALRTGQREGRFAGAKIYGEYDAGVVYRHADNSNPINVDFNDLVTRVPGASLPREVSTAPGFRNGVAGAIPIRLAFSTQAGLTCLVPAGMPTLIGRASTLLPGEVVRVRGTITGRAGQFATVLVDYLGFPAQEKEAGDDGDVWVVTVTWPGSAPRVFWDYGAYEVVGLPCRHAEGRFETMQVILGEFTMIEMEVPPAGPEAPAAEAE